MEDNNNKLIISALPWYCWQLEISPLEWQLLSSAGVWHWHSFPWSRPHQSAHCKHGHLGPEVFAKVCLYPFGGLQATEVESGGYGKECGGNSSPNISSLGCHNLEIRKPSFSAMWTWFSVARSPVSYDNQRTNPPLVRMSFPWAFASRVAHVNIRKWMFTLVPMRFARITTMTRFSLACGSLFLWTTRKNKIQDCMTSTIDLCRLLWKAEENRGMWADLKS